MTPNLTLGEEIRNHRECLGYSQRRMASKIGISTRKLIACETDTDVKPKLEKRVHRMVYVDFLGYEVRIYEDLPVHDKTFDLVTVQTRVLEFLTGESDGKKLP